MTPRRTEGGPTSAIVLLAEEWEQKADGVRLIIDDLVARRTQHLSSLAALGAREKTLRECAQRLREIDEVPSSIIEDPEPDLPGDCDRCETTYKECTKSLLADRGACCGSCGYTVTHNQNAWEEWDRRQRA